MRRPRLRCPDCGTRAVYLLAMGWACRDCGQVLRLYGPIVDARRPSIEPAISSTAPPTPAQPTAEALTLFAP